jgi:hypothetical protein
MRTWIVAGIVLGLMCSAGTVKATHVVINSADWKDVYTGIMYAELKGYDPVFFVSEYDSADIIGRLPVVEPNVILIESDDVPFVPNFELELEKEGFRVHKVASRPDETANIMLAEDVDTDSFIIVGSTYGYDAISVASYAVLTNSYVFLLDDNANEIVNIMRRKNAKDVLIYGYLDPQTGPMFEEFNPKTIYEGDKYLDNIRIAEKFLEARPTTQAYLTSGDFMEPSLFGKEYPVIFIGKDAVPDEMKEFIKNHIDVGVLVGNELFDSAQRLKDEIKQTKFFSVIIKFARGVGSGGTISYVRALEMFPVPSPATNISVVSVKYNLFTHQMEVVYKNNENTPTYFKSIITIFTDGVRKRTLGDEKINFLGPLDTVGIGYDMDLTDLINARMVLDVRIFTQYGAGVVSLTNFYEETFKNIEVFSVQDRSEGRLSSLVYNRMAKRFEIGVENTGNVPFYYRVELKFKAGEEEYTVRSNETLQIGPGGADVAMIPYVIEDDTISKISTVRVSLNYGERRDFLINKYESEFPFKVSEGFEWAYIVIALLVILILVYVIYRRVSE